MRKQQLPVDLRAEWIWSHDKRQRQESYLFLRKELTLEAQPSLGELWITAHTFFHVFINGRHLSFGPPPHPQKGRAYLCRYDVTHMLENGLNVIAVLAHNTQASRFAARRQPDGFLAQLNADGKPVAWTNNTWLAEPGHCFTGNRPRRTVSAGFSEKVDFAQYPTGWTDAGFNSSHWRHAEWHETVKNPEFELIPLDGSEFDSLWSPPKAVCSRGSCHPSIPQTHVCFQGLVDKFGPGVYAAQAYLFSPEPGEAAFSLFSDQPYKFLCNGDTVKEQGTVALPAGIDLDLAGLLCSRQGGTVNPDGVLKLEKGWNSLVVCQQVEDDSPGFTILVSGLPVYKWQLLREPDARALPGWGVAGPLRVPITNVTGSLDLTGMIRDGYHSEMHPPADEAANLLGYMFEPATADEQRIPETLSLMQGLYAVIDWGQIMYGVPAMRLEGAPGDCIDVLFGEKLENGRVVPCRDGRQNVDSITLGAGACEWMACAPRGLRYLMVVVRSAKGPVTISGITCGQRRFVSEKAGHFECSDELLNQIWEIGSRTLDVTMQDCFLDSPCKETAQYIPDAMIQSLTACVVHGNYAAGAKALQEFADAQFETGEMPAVCPSDNYVNIPDYALLWPIWLHRFYMYSGATSFLEQLMPALERLMNYFAFVADERSELLADLDKLHGAPCFLDHGTVERHGVVTGLNALYCRALWSSAWLAQEAKRTDLADIWRSGAGRLAIKMRDFSRDPVTGVFADACNANGPSASRSWQTNVLALYGGLARPEELEKVFMHFFSRRAPYEQFKPDASENPYFKFFVLETALALGFRKWAVDYIRHYWGGMLKHGAVTWWEFFSPRLHEDGMPKNGSLCHGYGVIPNLLFMTEIAGIRPATPGFRSVYFNPLLDSVDWAKAELTTPHGRIQVHWTRKSGNEVAVNLSSSYPLEVIPMLEAGVAASATFTVSDSITVLAPVAEGG